MLITVISIFKEFILFIIKFFIYIQIFFILNVYLFSVLVFILVLIGVIYEIKNKKDI